MGTRHCQSKGCDRTPVFAAYAAYPDPDDQGAAHTLLRRYPMPMVRACSAHLGHLLMEDERRPGSTAGWYVRAELGG